VEPVALIDLILLFAVQQSKISRIAQNGSLQKAFELIFCAVTSYFL